VIASWCRTRLTERQTAFEISKLAHEWRRGLDVTMQLSDVIKSGGKSRRANQTFSQYCSAWVDESLESTWRSLYELCRHASKDDRNRLAFVLATLAYHNPNQRQLCRTLLAFATNHIFKLPNTTLPTAGASISAMARFRPKASSSH
jgi:inorganic triphosphatase YgiF